ncbi:MAG: HAMP domain-containing sensor histidine kinase, partial [Azonexus sp.]
LGDLLRQVVADQFTLAEAKAIDLGVSALDPAAVVIGDADALHILLANLVSNALRYTPPSGRVDVSCGSGDGMVWLEVADNGPGIPVAERERVFDRFYRRSGQDVVGSGLGLSIVHSIAQRHKATIRLDDAPGGGLRVRVAFPAGARTVDN